MPDRPSIAITYRRIDELRPNPRNARTHSKRQVEQIRRSIEVFGFVNPIIVDETGTVLAGHGRLRAAKQLGHGSVPTVCLDDLTDAQKRAYVLADNKIAEAAGWDRELVRVELGDLVDILPSAGLDIAITGFEMAEIDSLDADLGTADPGDVLPAFEAKPVTRRGDTWLLHHHRLVCGDARSEADLDRAMAAAEAQMVFTDPPYNVRVAGHVQGRGRKRHAEFAFASGEMDEQAYGTFLDDALRNLIRRSRSDALHYVCIDWRHIDTLLGVARPRYAALLNIVVWNKTNAGQGSFYRSQYEMIAVLHVGSDPHRNNVELGRFGRNRSNVWTYPGVNSFGAGRAEALAMHPTVKPVAMVVDAIRDCTVKNDVVLDPFLGSGTTLLAAERIGRRCCAIEYDPAYVDLAVRRWQAATKRDAVLEGDGRTFAEMQAERAEPQHDEGRLGPGSDDAPVRLGDAR